MTFASDCSVSKIDPCVSPLPRYLTQPTTPSGSPRTLPYQHLYPHSGMHTHMQQYTRMCILLRREMGPKVQICRILEHKLHGTCAPCYSNPTAARCFFLSHSDDRGLHRTPPAPVCYVYHSGETLENNNKSYPSCYVYYASRVLK